MIKIIINDFQRFDGRKICINTDLVQVFAVLTGYAVLFAVILYFSLAEAQFSIDQRLERQITGFLKMQIQIFLTIIIVCSILTFI